MEKKLEYTVWEHLEGTNKGGRFMTSYFPKCKVGDTTDNGWYKVIAHCYTHSEALEICEESDYNRGMHNVLRNYGFM